jgi:L-asparaginase
MAIRIFVTGGTFDKEYDELKGVLYFKDTHVHEILQLGRAKIEVQVSTLMMIDSLEMNQEHRLKIIEACKEIPENQIIITHGTDTLEVTAQELGLANIGKTIVLTGAMIPYKFGSSDGLFNLGCALGFVQVLPHGVYVAMQGRYFHWDNVTKNKKKGVFEPKSKTKS